MASPQRTKLKDHRVLALDIGSRFIKVSELRLARSIITLEKIAVAPVPPEAMDKGQIVDPLLLGKTIRGMLTSNKFTARKVIAALRGQSSVVVRPIDLPKMTLKELKDTMKFEVERHIPFAADEIAMDYAPFADPSTLPDTDENMKVLLAVAQEDLVKTYIKIIRTAKLSPIALDVEILATIRALVDIHQQSGSYEQTMALVNLGAGSTDISIVSQGNLVFNRSVPLAGDALTNAIAEHLGYAAEEAEELKKEHGQVFLDTIAGELPLPQSVPTATEAGMFEASGPMDATISWTTEGGDTLPQHIFSLDDEPQGPIPFAMEAPAAPPAAEMHPFALDPEPAAPDAQQEHPIFTLDDPASMAPVPSTQAEPASPVNRPVFDLSSELEEQLPPARSRPIFSLDDPADAEASASALLPTAPPSPAPTSVDGIFASPAVDEAPDPASAPAFSPQPDTMTEESVVPSAPTPTNAQNEVLQRRLFEAMQPILGEIVTEIRRSLEYFSNREPEHPVERILIYGGTSRLPRLAEYLHHEIGVDVQYADPLAAIDTTPCQLPAEYLQDLAPALPVCIGLGIRDMLA